MTTSKSNRNLPLFCIYVDPEQCQLLCPEAACDLETACDSKWPDDGGLVDYHFEQGQAWLVNRIIGQLLAAGVAFIYEFDPAKASE